MLRNQNFHLVAETQEVLRKVDVRNLVSAPEKYVNYRNAELSQAQGHLEDALFGMNVGYVELIDYAYTLEIQINTGNVQSILTAALFLDIVPVSYLCWEFVEKHMDAASCLMIHCLAVRHQNARLVAKAEAMVLRNFVRISRGADFRLIDAEKMVDLIASDDLRVENEDDVLEAVMRWLDHDPAGRKAHLSDVLQFVRVVFLGPASLEKYFLALYNALNKSPAVDLPLSSRMASALPNRQTEAIASRCRPRESYGTDSGKLLSALRSLKHGKESSSVIVFLPSASSVLRFASLPNNIDAPGLAVLENGSLLACGGRSGPEASENRVWRYDNAGYAWTELQPLQQRRYGMGVAALNGRVYAVGG
ncbi:kelch-like protein diablo [Paramacrobiotus metropolitanus]|uniref:kelch-like protein diablo n=1 Tax=Paramacrobiotus metropolitanus TaxID=2943436 RepID=UPI0024460EBC|nr:kelch-like protein diablo [Paramacrobiotus metropolitanus]